VNIEVLYAEENILLTQKKMAELFWHNASKYNPASQKHLCKGRS
jgi:hypothetical protein